MKFLVAVALLGVALASAGPPNSEAPTGFDNKSNGMVDDGTHQVDQAKFDGVENVSDGLGPLYNAQSCRECPGAENTRWGVSPLPLNGAERSMARV